MKSSFWLAIIVLGIFIPKTDVFAAPTHVASGSFDFTLPVDNSPVDSTFDSGSTGSNRFMVIHVTYRNASAHVIPDNGVIYAGVTATPFGAAVVNSQTYSKAFYILSPATGSNTLRVDPTTGVGTQAAAVSAYVYSDVDQVTPFDGYVTNTGVDDTGELTVTSAVGDTPIFLMGWRGGGATSGTPTNYTERVDNIFGTGANITLGGDGVGDSSVNFVGTVDGEFSSTGWVTMGANLNSATVEMIRRGLLRMYSNLAVIRSGFIRIGR